MVSFVVTKINWKPCTNILPHPPRSDDEFDENSVEAQQASIDRSPRVPEQMKRGLSDIMASGEAGNGDAKVRSLLDGWSFLFQIFKQLASVDGSLLGQRILATLTDMVNFPSASLC